MRIRARDAEIDELRHEIARLQDEVEYLRLLLALTMGRTHIARERFVEVARLLRKLRAKAEGKCLTSG